MHTKLQTLSWVVLAVAVAFVIGVAVMLHAGLAVSPLLVGGALFLTNAIVAFLPAVSQRMGISPQVLHLIQLFVEIAQKNPAAVAQIVNQAMAKPDAQPPASASSAVVSADPLPNYVSDTPDAAQADGQSDADAQASGQGEPGNGA